MPTLQFKGKPLVQNHHLVVPFSELEAVKSRGLSKSPSLHDNLIIEGDNLKALKALLPTYHGKVKCIYIDPPYNTGNEGWVYNDRVNSPMMRDWLGKTVDRDDLTRHDKWCCMMLPRLKLLRELLSDDGAIFVSIDDNEVHHLRALMDEVFDDENWVGTVIWKNATDNNPTNIAIEHESIHVFARRKENLSAVWKSEGLAVKTKLEELQSDLLKKFTDADERQKSFSEWLKANKPYIWPFQDYKFIDDKGIFTGIRGVHNPGKEGYRYAVKHPKTGKACDEPLMGYRFPPETMKELLAENRIIFGEDEHKVIELKAYLSDYKAKLASVFELDGRAGTNELKEIFQSSKSPLRWPKPSALLKHLLSFTADKDSLILDSFAGSGTTAHAVLALNHEDGGNRRFILCQMPYETKEQEKEKENICESITAERVRRVIKGVPNARDEEIRKGLGGTFSYFKLGKELRKQAILDGKDLPSYAALAGYVFFTATGEEFQPKKMKPPLIGTSRERDVFLIYEEDIEKLKDMALNLDLARKLGKSERKKLVFAPTKYLDQEYLDRLNIEFCQLPFEIYQRATKK